MLLLAVGVVICAAAGIQLGEVEYSAVAEEGRAALAAASADAQPALPASPQKRLAGWLAMSGVPFAGGLALLIIGAVMARIAIGRDGGAASGGADAADFAAGLERLVAAIREAGSALDAADAEPVAVRQRIELIQQDHLEPLVEARSALQRRVGLTGYAAVLGSLSGAERLLNRAWSALVDGHLPEGRESLAGAADEAELALAALESLS